MEADAILLLKFISGNDFTFFIPPYQRNYEWTTDQCGVFLDDVIKTTESNKKEMKAQHFLGSLTYYETERVFGQPSKLILIDGQQRVTTTMLFLIAVRDLLDNQEDKDTLNNTYLLNKQVKGDSMEYKIKLKQVEADWDSYKSIILAGDIDSKEKDSCVYKNYKFFYNKLSAKKNKGENLIDLVKNGLYNFTIVTIELKPDANPWENPQEVFESMNSLGKPLSLADLVRNYILLGLSLEEQSQYYKQYWMHVEKTLPGHLSEFIRDYMQLHEQTDFKVASEQNYKELYRDFKNIFYNRVLPDSSIIKYDIKGLMKELHDYADIYEFIILGSSTGNDRVDSLLRDLRYLSVSTAFSFIMALLYEWKKKEPAFKDSDMIGILEALFIYFARRRIIGETNAENKSFPALTKKIERLIKAQDKKDEMFKILASQEENCRLPKDMEVTLKLKDMNFYHFKYCEFYLSLIEESLTKGRPSSDKKLQKEHIMPQKITRKEWKDALGDNYLEKHQEYVDRIGNITLIRHNQELGNKSFEEKKVTYLGNEGLVIARRMITDCDVWNIDTIENRGEWLINYIVTDVLPIPDRMRNLNNFVTKERKGLSFVELGLIGQQITFIKDHSITAKVVSDKQVEFEGTRWKLSPLTRELMIRRGEQNKSGAYQGAQYWCYEDIKLADALQDLE